MLKNNTLVHYLDIGWKSIYKKKIRSFLTVSGIVLGVVLSLLTVSFFQGYKKQIEDSLNFNDNLITVRSGQSVTRDETGSITGFSISQNLGVGPTLTLQDFQEIEALEGIGKIAPVVVLNSPVTTLDDKQLSGGHVIASNSDLIDLVNYEIDRGSLSGLDRGQHKIAFVGRKVHENLLNNESYGRSIKIDQTDYLISGNLSPPEIANPLNLDYTKSVIIPFEVLLTDKEEFMIYEILVEAKPGQRQAVLNQIDSILASNHETNLDFSVFHSNEVIFLSSGVFEFFRPIIFSIALIALTISGIGIMNIMYTTVSERSLEISVRKSIGATSYNIFSQFLTEALLLSFLGSLLGIIVAYFVILVTYLATDIQPVVQLNVILAVIFVSFINGLVFGFMPAIKASRKKITEYLS